eukprot:TRINITY_DN9563_c0_g1_i1.p1 TRINITY_DN9563_c0_g1~~TRINITY_DN9563_c0_g1_i1.p1  ORF type:complete len:698 (-),score=141.82 TRINITY_DN9563_c0_g1_i1:33-2093(-)
MDEDDSPLMPPVPVPLTPPMAPSEEEQAVPVPVRTNGVRRLVVVLGAPALAQRQRQAAQPHKKQRTSLQRPQLHKTAPPQQPHSQKQSQPHSPQLQSLLPQPQQQEAPLQQQQQEALQDKDGQEASPELPQRSRRIWQQQQQEWLEHEQEGAQEWKEERRRNQRRRRKALGAHGEQEGGRPGKKPRTEHVSRSLDSVITAEEATGDEYASAGERQGDADAIHKRQKRGDSEDTCGIGRKAQDEKRQEPGVKEPQQEGMRNEQQEKVQQNEKASEQVQIEREKKETERKDQEPEVEGETQKRGEMAKGNQIGNETENDKEKQKHKEEHEQGEHERKHQEQEQGQEQEQVKENVQQMERECCESEKKDPSAQRKHDEAARAPEGETQTDKQSDTEVHQQRRMKLKHTSVEDLASTLLWHTEQKADEDKNGKDRKKEEGEESEESDSGSKGDAEVAAMPVDRSPDRPLGSGGGRGRGGKEDAVTTVRRGPSRPPKGRGLGMPPIWPPSPLQGDHVVESSPPETPPPDVDLQRYSAANRTRTKSVDAVASLAVSPPRQKLARLQDDSGLLRRPYPNGSAPLDAGGDTTVQLYQPKADPRVQTAMEQQGSLISTVAAQAHKYAQAAKEVVEKESALWQKTIQLKEQQLKRHIDVNFEEFLSKLTTVWWVTAQPKQVVRTRPFPPPLFNEFH